MTILKHKNALLANASTNTIKTATISPTRLAELLASVRAKKLAPAPTVELNSAVATESLEISTGIVHQGFGKHGELITYNEEQQEFISTVLAGDNCVLTGAAGTGKTTCVMGAINSLLQSNTIPIIQNCEHKHIPAYGVPGIIATSFTRRAVSNLRKAMPAGLDKNCLTIHKLLEYEPVYYEVIDPETGDTKNTMRFEPTRNSYRPLPDSIKVVIIDESSMVSVELFQQLVLALPHNPQFIFIGDIQQLPPVFGSAILGFKMLEHKTVELIQVYRQALESPIIKYATDIKDGKTFILQEKLIEETPRGKITIHPWKKKLSPDVAMLTFCKFITTAYDHEAYNPDNDCILIPFNKAFGTIEVNKHIAQHIARKQGRVVWEVIAGFNKLYFSVGDKVLYDKEDAEIVSISPNKTYLGKKPQKESVTLDYWGHNPNIAESVNISDPTMEEVDLMLEQMAAFTGDANEDRVRAASHIITIRMIDSEKEIIVDTASDLNSLLLSYTLTVHKAQGSEWDKVFLILHQSHNTMIQRELLYTAITRAAKELYVICEPDCFEKGVLSQKIKGNTLAEKAIWFQGKKESGGLL